MTAVASEMPMPIGYHLMRTFQLALPIILSRAAIVVMLTVDTIMTGWAGARELAYFGLGIAAQLTLMMIAIGALQATVVMTAQAAGSGDEQRAGDVLRASLFNGIALGVVVLCLSFVAEDFFLATGQAPDLAQGAAGVSVIFGFGMPGMLLFIAGNLFLEATGRPHVGMTIMIVANLLNVPLNGILALGWGGIVDPMGAEGAMLGSSVLRTVAGLLIACEIARSSFGQDRYGLLSGWRPWLLSLATFGGDIGRELRRLGLPMGLAQGVESAAFATVVLMAGRLGAMELAGYQAVLALVSLTFMMAVGTGGATAIRVGRAIGAGDRQGARRAGFAGIALGALLPLPIAGLFLLSPETAAGFVTDNEQVAAVAAGAFIVAAFMLSADAAMGVTVGALRGFADVWVPTLLQVAAFWLVAVPTAYMFGLRLGIGAPGLIGGLLAGVYVSFAALVWRFLSISR
ncbi:MATE family efflux transporter [Stappia sp. F7233]|uniref:MATE family efflux transporter n=1 Tax=Stappia albiluteola TaxID=2758565 RepID=A0A839AD72_9HYPH|nr:MATE family efflux transporter [Stappia albiluteola]MBA5776978.1 MATE family efflux transporter [Stappia albiluteola]